jgi:hypothetical protein
VCSSTQSFQKPHPAADWAFFGRQTPNYKMVTQTERCLLYAALVDRSFLHILQHTDLMGLGQEISEFLEWRPGEACLPPQIRCQEPISLQQTLECSLWEKKTQSKCLTQSKYSRKKDMSKNQFPHVFHEEFCNRKKTLFCCY